jgi:tRNA G37 N-methylase TrmD
VRSVMCVIESTCRGCLCGILMDLVVHARESFANEDTLEYMALMNLRSL